MSKTLYLVWAETGEYADKREWNVCAYVRKALAERHVKLAQARADELMREHDGRYYDIPAGANQYDPDMSSDYTGVTYGFGLIDLRDKLPV